MKPHLSVPDPAEPAIQHAAYLLWEQNGRPAGRDLEFWFTARETLRHSVPAPRPPRTRRAALVARDAQFAGRKRR